MKLLGRTQPLQHLPIDDVIALLSTVGFDGVEVCLENPDLAPQGLNASRVARVAELIAEHGLSPHSVSYHKDYIFDDKEQALTRAAIELTPDFGTSVFVFSGARKRTGDREEWALLVSRTRELVRVAEGSGVTLALEHEPGFLVGTTAELLQLIEEIGSDCLAANLDLGHTFLVDPDPLAAIRSLGKRIVHCHVENMKAGVHKHLLPQEGDMDLGVYFRELAAVGFTGGLALDLYGVDYAAVAPEALAYLRSLMPAGAPPQPCR